MSSAAAQKASKKSFQIFSTFAVVDPTQPTKNWKISTQPNLTQPMDNSALAWWRTGKVRQSSPLIIIGHNFVKR